MPGLGCGMWDIVPWPGIEPWPPALRAWSLSHQATREAPSYAPAQNYPHQVHEMPNHSVRCWSVLGVVQLHRTSQFIEHFLPFFDHSAELGGCGDLQSRDGSVSRCPWPTANAQRISGPGPSISASMMDFKIPNGSAGVVTSLSALCFVMYCGFCFGLGMTDSFYGRPN